MKRYVTFVLMGLVAMAIGGNEADGRGWGGYRGGSWGGGGFSRESSFSGSRSESFALVRIQWLTLDELRWLEPQFRILGLAFGGLRRKWRTCRRRQFIRPIV
jgi:hypothetical protein